MSKISKHISFKEATRSQTATRHGIDNLPNQYQITNMQITAQHIFEPLRKWVGGAIRVNSFFRSPKTNRLISGSSRSQHCDGRAMDIDDTYEHKTNAEMFNFIRENLNFDQLIWEFGDHENPDWVHVSYVSDDQNRNNVLVAYRENGKTKYKNYA